jgi:hypothetical protein
MKYLNLIILTIVCNAVSAQHLVFPDGDRWRVPFEGDDVTFRVLCDSIAPAFSIEGGQDLGIQFDSTGNFNWKPSFDLVDRLEKQKEFTVIFQGAWKNGKKVRKPITFIVTHQNRPPVVEDLPVFYVKQSSTNQYQVSADYVSDPDGDPLTYKSIVSALPEGASMSSLGLVTWTLSRNQFLAMKSTPVFIEFTVQDPDKAETKGKVRVAQTQLDLPPELLLVPADSVYSIKEDQRINIKLYVTDPNGDDNISSVSFVCNDERVAKSSLKENSAVQSEFTWSPGYYFVEEAEKTRQVELIFFALDKASNRIQRKVKVKVADTENIDEKDKFTYQKYRNSLIQARALIVQLDENHDKLTKMYKQAKRGKKNRAILNAGLGATTGLSPVAIKQPDASKLVSAIGGTTVLTMGTLEATEVIGKSKADILDRLKINVEIRNQLQVEGDNFARKFALKSARRNKEFDTDREKLLPILNNQKLVLLELDASRPSLPDFTNKEIKSTFPDFAEE